MRNTFTLGAVFGVGMLLFCGCASTPKSDLSRLQGNWAGTEIGGEKGQCRMTIEGDTIKFQGARQGEWYVGKLTLLPKANPRQATFLVESCAFPQYINKTAKAIYKVQGNSLKIAACEPGSEMTPPAFESDSASQTRAFAFTRQ